MSGKSQNLFTVRLNDRYSQEATIAEYLKDSSEATGKEKATRALLNFYESIALSESGKANKNDIERAAIRCLQNLHSQMLDIVTYHRLQDEVNLPSEILRSIGLPTSSLESVAPSPSPIATSDDFNYDFSALD
jgi:hypothetical protein